jgi:hypothetical protein
MSIEMDWAEGKLIQKVFVKERGAENFVRAHILSEPFKVFSASLFIEWLFGTQLPIAHTAPAAAFVLHHTVIGKRALNKSGTSFQMLLWKLRQEHINSVCGFFGSRLAL